ncbi:DUF3857 domain-containing protein [Sphingobacterium paramultivorum]|uniref:DUF3857 domain-containing protein n=1 Tax=Sphingobacterium paramultivorum TaxID=2886510 RepID=A0A7G5DYB2_9SPHI|nr:MULTISPECIES: DUF3857 domain-containing protein [Sphingobacterium]MCS4163351.1 hypothetical protein [Sphingobacterium sp. BIGb0116]QMV66737.1 DUF3857 domain-containing protein [Sphingobacterium paramultivorum]WSO15560.1 DUF3857 domain-containing protein [Sphingobacterium paramultivorum]
MKRFSHLLLAFILLLATFSWSFSQTSVQKVATPSWLRPLTKKAVKPNLDDISDGYYFELIEHQINLATQTKYYKDIKVLFDQSGVENLGQVQVTFDPHFQKLQLHELKIIRNGKDIDILPKAKFNLLASETELSRSIYNGSQMAHYVLEDLRKDDKIVFAYSIVGANPVFEQMFFDSYYLQGYEPTGLIHLNYIVPNHRKLHFKSFNGAPEVQQQSVGNSTNFFWELTEHKPVQYENYTPDWYSPLQYIQCSEFNTWKDIDQWKNRINPIPQISPSSTLQTFVNQLWKESNGQQYEFIRKACDFVQNEIRYMGIEMGEYSHRANLPEKVFSQRYGDCKDKSMLLATMLKNKNIDVGLVLANTYKSRGLQNDLPSPYAFNHMVIELSIEGRHQYIDPTITNQGGDIKNRYFPTYGKVLSTLNRGQLADVPQKVVGDIKVKEVLALEGKFDATLDVTTTYRGNEADNIRNYFQSNAKNDIQKQYLDYYTKTYSKINKVGSMDYKDDSKNNIVEIVEKYKIKNIGKSENGSTKKYISLIGSNINEKLPEIMEDRNAPLDLPFPTDIEYEIYLVNKAQKTFGVYKENSFFDRKAYTFGKTLEIKADSIKIHYTLGMHESFVEQADLKQYYTDFADRDNIFYNGFYLDTNGYATDGIPSLGTPTSSHEVNWFSSIIFLISVASVLWYIIKKYNKSKPIIIKPYDQVYHEQIGGWMILLLVVLIANILALSSLFFFNLSLFNLNTWQAMDHVDGVSSFVYKVLILAETVANTLIIIGLIYSCILLIKRRDIFAQTFFLITLFMAIFCTLDAIAGYFMFKQYFNKTDDIFTKYEDTIRTIIFFCIWGSYAYKSERVKGTCLRTYQPANTVHKAEKPHPFDEDFLKPYPMSEPLIETRVNEDKVQNDSMCLDQSSNQNAEK